MMKLVWWAIEKPKKVMYITAIMSVIFLAVFPFLKIDTDPENMLSENEEVRVMHTQLKKEYAMYDIIVMGVVNEKHPEGVFNTSSLGKIYELSEYINSIEFDPDLAFTETTKQKDQIIKRDIMSPTNIDHIESIGGGALKFDWLMEEAPKSDIEAKVIRDRLLSNDMYKNTIVSEDGKALCFYLPISSKDISYDVANLLKEEVKKHEGDDQFYITGLPVAEDTFGIEMFIQMAITAPLAMACIFLLMFYFFRKINLIVSPMIVAMVSVIVTMGLLIGCGFTVHIMSSMIPIFVMPIAVLDSVHILSEFFDRYPQIRDRKKTLEVVVKELFKPMLFTSLTSAAGFASLALTPIPPVQVFGVFVAIGILMAWLMTIIFIPAYIMLMKEESLKDFGNQNDDNTGLLSRFLNGLNGFTRASSRLILLGSLMLLGLAIYGISLIQINDNPVKWFSKNHEIRVADRALNKHFGGSYMAYLNISPSDIKDDVANTRTQLTNKINQFRIENNVSPEIQSNVLSTLQLFKESKDSKGFYTAVLDQLYEVMDAADDDTYEVYEQLVSMIEQQALTSTQIFKDPAVLNYISGLEEHLYKNGGVGKINSLNSIVKKVNLELHDGDPAYFKIPDNINGVGQCILSFQNSHIPERLRHFVNNDYDGLNLWMQLKSGDNKDMENTVASVQSYFDENKPPVSLSHNWYGLTYINVVWQQKMVSGMAKAFLGSFIVVFLMMCFLFRSIKWALLCMLPLTITIAVIYGFVGFIGKDYDMPVAVLSSLALGLAIDFSIHFLVRSRHYLNKNGSWDGISRIMFGEPARAITRNIIVIAVGFLPLIFSNLIPYKTVGLLLASILTLSGIVTMVLLPALIKTFDKSLIDNK